MLYKIIPEFLGPADRERLLAFALANESRFHKSSVGTEGRYDPTVRESNWMNELGDLAPLIEKRVLSQLPGLIADLVLPGFQPTGVEIELVAHGHDAFFARHIDLFTGSGRNPGADRLVSVTYYFFREPKAFSGGVLRIYPIGKESPANHPVDIPPGQDTAVVFPSWVPHEVLPVSCPSGEFADSRFAVNCWILRQVVRA